MIVIIGAGISGLTAAHFLKKEFLILEKEIRPGGLSGEYECGPYRFPYGGHYFHFQHKPDVAAFVQSWMPFRAYRRRSRVFLHDRFVPFPVQYHLAYLRPADREEISRQMLAPAGAAAFDRGLSLEDFLRLHFGERLWQLFFRPYLEKFYGQRLDLLLADMDKGSIPLPAPAEVRAGLAGHRFDQAGYNPRFYYPASFSLQDFINRYAAPLSGRLHLRRPVIGVDLERRLVRTAAGPISFRQLINTMPLDRFMTLCGRGGEAESLRHISTLVVNCVLRRRRRRFHWLYLPQERLPFYRAGYYPGPGAVRVYLEKSLQKARLPSSQRIREEALQTLKAAGMIEKAGEVEHLSCKLIPVSYILFDRRWPHAVPPLLARLRRQGVFSVGRFGSWNYTSMADDMQNAMTLARELNET